MNRLEEDIFIRDDRFIFTCRCGSGEIEPVILIGQDGEPVVIRLRCKACGAIQDFGRDDEH